MRTVSASARPRDRLLWFGRFHAYVQREADLFIRTHGPLAYRYARDHVRLGQRRKRARDETLYAAVAEEISKRSTSTRRAACAAGAVCLPDWLPVLNGALAILA
jgi:hypothetical protein